MFSIQDNDIFSGIPEATLCPVNCSGRFHYGLISHYMQFYPAIRDAYLRSHELNLLQPGKLEVFTLARPNKNTKHILTLPVQTAINDRTSLFLIENSCVQILQCIEQYQLNSLWIPAIGCENGGMDFNRLSDTLYRHFCQVNNCDIVLLKPHQAESLLL